MTPTGGGTSGRGLAKGQRREFGERLHGRLATPNPAGTLVEQLDLKSAQPPEAVPEADAETETETETSAWMCDEAFAAAAI